jgi:hypothetical protein
MLTAEGGWSIALLAGGLLLLFSAFACLQSRHYREILAALKRNRAITHEARNEKRSFDSAQVRMRESGSFHEWWETVCSMGKQMHFECIGLWSRRNGNYKSICVWNAPEEECATGETVKLTLPLCRNGTAEWEIRARIGVNGYLELSGRQAMLLARLMDEFPPPEQKEETKPLDKHGSTTDAYTITGEAGPSLCQ